MDEFETNPPQGYQKIRPLLERVAAELKQKLKEVLAELGDPNLVRARVIGKRIKSAHSLARKTRQKGWKSEEAISKAKDLVGLRIVCHNLQDVRRAADLLEESFKRNGLRVKRDDYISKPQKSGYRAIHLSFKLNEPTGKETAGIGCEIQIRSLLQHSWAELSRADIYTPDFPIPPSVRSRMVSLSKVLSKADLAAESVRTDIVRPRRGRRPSFGQPLNGSAVAFLYRQRFKEDPPDYLVQSVLRETAGLKIRSDGLSVALEDVSFTERLELAYREVSGWEPQPAQVFFWVIDSLIYGKDTAIRHARAEARVERREIAQTATRDMLSGVNSVEAMLCTLEYAQKDEDPESEIETWAIALGVDNRCAICGTAIVDPSEFAEAAIKHYKVRGKRAESLRERLIEEIESRGIETGSWDSPYCCSHCSNAFDRA